MTKVPPASEPSDPIPHKRRFDLRSDPILDDVTRFTADEFADALTWWFEFDGDPGHWGGALAEVERRGATVTVLTNAGQRFTIQVQATADATSETEEERS